MHQDLYFGWQTALLMQFFETGRNRLKERTPFDSTEADRPSESRPVMVQTLRSHGSECIKFVFSSPLPVWRGARREG